jgi:hypothetical protein
MADKRNPFAKAISANDAIERNIRQAKSESDDCHASDNEE